MKCACGCKVELLPEGTLVVDDHGEAWEVRPWCPQDHHQVPLVPVFAGARAHGLLALRRTLTIKLLGTDPLLGPCRKRR